MSAPGGFTVQGVDADGLVLQSAALATAPDQAAAAAALEPVSVMVDRIVVINHDFPYGTVTFGAWP